jgi:hypothetical protein
MKTAQPTISIYTVRARTGLPAIRFEIEVAVVGETPRVTVIKDGREWCEDVSVPEAFEAVSYLTMHKQCKATLRTKIERAAFAAALAA